MLGTMAVFTCYNHIQNAKHCSTPTFFKCDEFCQIPRDYVGVFAYVHADKHELVKMKALQSVCIQDAEKWQAVTAPTKVAIFKHINVSV